MIPSLAITLTEIIKEGLMPYLPHFIATGVAIFCVSHASAFTVTTLTNTDSDLECSLQEAIAAANNNAATGGCGGTEFDIIDFHADLFVSDDVSKLTLDLDITDLPLLISDNLEITIPDDITIDGNEFSHEVNVTLDNDLGINGVLFSVGSNVSFELSRWNIDGSSSTDATIASLSNNTNLTFNSVRIENFANESTSLINTDGLIHTDDSLVAGTVIINGSLFRNNQTTGNGAAINIEASSLQITSTFFSNNQALDDSTPSSGGAISIYGATEAVIKNSSFFGNSAATNGGAIANMGTLSSLKIENTNFMLNGTIGHGGAIYTLGNIYLFNNSFLINSADTSTEDEDTHQGGALFVDSAVTGAEIYNSLFHLNFLIGSVSSDCSGPISALEYSILLPSGDCTFPETITSVNSQASNLPISAILTDMSEFIGYNTSSNQIIDQGDPDGCLGIDGTDIQFDVTGSSRHVDATNGDEGVCDIGSTEIKPLTLVLSTDQESYKATYDSSVEEQERIPVTLTIENTGNVDLTDLDIRVTTPAVYSLIINDERASSPFILAEQFSLAAGQQTTFDLEFVSNTSTLSGLAIFSITARDPNYVNLGPAQNTLLSILLEGPPLDLTLPESGQIITANTTEADESSSSGGGALLWLTPLIGLLLTQRKRRKSLIAV
jgi:predicted outer membrane repeat protein